MTEAKQDWKIDFYRNGVPEEVIVIEDTPPPSSTGSSTSNTSSYHVQQQNMPYLIGPPAASTRSKRSRKDADQTSNGLPPPPPPQQPAKRRRKDVNAPMQPGKSWCSIDEGWFDGSIGSRNIHQSLTKAESKRIDVCCANTYGNWETDCLFVVVCLWCAFICVVVWWQRWALHYQAKRIPYTEM